MKIGDILLSLTKFLNCACYCSCAVTAFGSDGLLVGVAGIDLYLDQLEGDLYANVVAAVSNRTRGTLPAPANLNLSCNYQVIISPT